MTSLLINQIIRTIDLSCSWLGRNVSWLTTILVLVIFIDVIFRYLFSSSQAWITEFEWHLFALIFLLGAAYTFQENDHVRVDLFYTNFSEKKKAIINLVGILLFLIPWCLIVLLSANKYASNSFAINEASPDPGGLPARWLIKYAIVVGFIFLLLQSISVLLKCIQVLFNRRAQIFETKGKEE